MSHPWSKDHQPELVVNVAFSCPCCERGTVDPVTRVCSHCRVAVPRADVFTPGGHWGPPRNRYRGKRKAHASADEKGLSDYIHTKEDHADES